MSPAPPPAPASASPADPSEPAPKTVLIWGVDDGQTHLERIERTFNRIAAPELVIETWLDGRKAAEVYERRLEIDDVAGLPRLILLDYFLGEGCTGVEVAHKILDAYRRRPPHARKARKPILVGHSSVADCSLLIAQVGGGFVLAKHSSELISAAIYAAFETPEQRAYLWKHGKPRRET